MIYNYKHKPCLKQSTEKFSYKNDYQIIVKTI